MQIIQKTTRITAQEEVQGVTVMYSYESENDNNPIAVAFSATRQQDGGYPYLQGTVTANDFNVQNSKFQPSDIELYKQIQERCTAIINGTEKIDKSKNK
jgi:hypothetical protein|nr:MAG TPA: hypothetical protein [Caudoviricetes sp.]